MSEIKQAKLKPRKCRYCRARFTPERPQDSEATFCTEEHRVAFHVGGGSKEYQRLLNRLSAEVIRDTVFHKVLAKRQKDLREQLDKAVDEAIQRRYTPERIAEILMSDSRNPVNVAIRETAKAIWREGKAEMAQKEAKDESVQVIGTHGTESSEKSTEGGETLQETASHAGSGNTE